MPSMELFLFFVRVVPGSYSLCFSVIRYIRPSLGKNQQGIWLRMQSLKSPVRRIWYLAASHLSISSLVSCRNPCLEHIILFFLLKNVRCCEYTDPGPPPFDVGTVLYKVAIIRYALPCPLNFGQLHLPIPEGYLLQDVFLVVIFTVEREYVPPYWKSPIKGSF